MIIDQHGDIDFDECGEGPTILLVPGSCSTGAAWRGVVDRLRVRFRCITTSLCGYGGTAERRSKEDSSIARVAEALEIAIRAAGTPVHLVGHSFGGLVALAVALRQDVPLASLTVLEPPAVSILAHNTVDAVHARAFRRMVDEYRNAHAAGDAAAIDRMIDFYGGAGTFASWPAKVRNYAMQTTPVNLIDWRSAYGLALAPAELARIDVPTLILRGSDSHTAIWRITDRLTEQIAGSRLGILDAASHFMLATHPGDVADAIADHVRATMRAGGSHGRKASGRAHPLRVWEELVTSAAAGCHFRCASR